MLENEENNMGIIIVFFKNIVPFGVRYLVHPVCIFSGYAVSIWRV